MADDSTEKLLVKESPENEHRIYEEVKSFSKAKQNQQLAMEELISTETSYVHNLQLCFSDIRHHLQKKQVPEIDLEGLFSNIDDVLHVSRHFLTGLEATANQEQEQLLHVSTLFQELKEEMENVYKVYCSNYDQALLLLDTYRKDPRLQKQILDTLQTTVPHTGASDLSFFLVMPVQRITKYPLLLRKILENTLDSDSAYDMLSAATKAMIEVNANINEYKRCKEVADKYNKAESLTLRERLARLNTHSIAKKTTRLGRLFMHEAGIIPKTEDKEFDDLEERFQRLASGVADLKENVTSFLCNAEIFFDSNPYDRELNIEEGTRYQCCHLTQKLNSTILPEAKKRLTRLVYLPLCSLAETLKGPQSLIRKRLDKLLDYEELEEKRNETGCVTYEEEAAMNTYLAINSLLMSELPVFNLVALKWLEQILHSFVVLQRDLSKQILQEAEGEIAQLPHKHLPEVDFWKMVRDTLSQAENQLYSFSRKFESVMPCSVVQHLSPAEERRVLSLLKKHGQHKLYQVTSNISGSKDMDLTLQRGQIVALLHDMDTKGNSNRWLVDAGGPRGYIPSGKVQLYHLAQNLNSKMEMLAANDGAERRHHSYKAPETHSPPINFIVPAFQVVAGYPFTPRSSHEVSLTPGQAVSVLEPHDKNGSKEWSLVEVNGQKGYVPSSYLVTMPTPGPPGWGSPAWPFPAQQT